VSQREGRVEWPKANGNPPWRDACNVRPGTGLPSSLQCLHPTQIHRELYRILIIAREASEKNFDFSQFVSFSAIQGGGQAPPLNYDRGGMAGLPPGSASVQGSHYERQRQQHRIRARMANTDYNRIFVILQQHPM